MRRYISSALLIGSLLGMTGCVGRVRVYDEPRRDYHRWNANEDRAYRDYLREQRREYRAFGTLERRDQDAYWEWRHNHPNGR